MNVLAELNLQHIYKIYDKNVTAVKDFNLEVCKNSRRKCWSIGEIYYLCVEVFHSLSLG